MVAWDRRKLFCSHVPICLGYIDHRLVYMTATGEVAALHLLFQVSTPDPRSQLVQPTLLRGHSQERYVWLIPSSRQSNSVVEKIVALFG